MKIITTGASPESFPIGNGTRQGCPLSPMLFALALEPLLDKLRSSTSITGLQIGGEEFLVSAYADDLLLTITDPVHSVPHLLSLLRDFSDISGFKINIDKSRSLPIGIPKPEVDRLRLLTGFHFSTSSLTYLGVKLTSDPAAMIRANYDVLIQRLIADMDTWDAFNVSWVGRIASVKMNLLPRILYLFQTLPVPVPPASLAHLQSHMDRFIWHNKRHRVARRVLHRPRVVGGLGVPSLLQYYHAAQLAQFVTFHAPPGTHRWADLESHLFAPDLPQFYFWLPKTYRPILRSTCTATINSLQIWDTVNRHFTLAKEHSAMMPFLRNRKFQPGLCPRPFANLEDLGLQRLHHLYSAGAPLQFENIRQRGPVGPADFFRYLQVMDYARTPEVRTAATSSLTAFEARCNDARITK
uniref:Reverse transcriptase domain-containing protein n=1 Tax=Leptobrachium leishanense TaxID=445787 RepID=A0A8C5QR67_9ANUR